MDYSGRYGQVVALREMTFDVRAGEFFGFVGSNGAGKTTTMRIALGVLAADSGEVRWDGAPVTLQTRRQIGYMPEERGLYPKMKVAEQLVYLARLLVLDEPFSGLDSVAVDIMSQVLLDKCREGVPVVFSSHQLDLVERLSDRVGIVRSGQMVACGTVDELRAGGTTRLVVDVPAARNGWAQGLPGVTVVGQEGTSVVLELLPDTDDQTVLRAALAAGPVREFARRRPSLTDLFRNVVTEGEAA